MKEKVIGKNPTIQQIIEWAYQNGFYVQFRLVEKSLPNTASTRTAGTSRQKGTSKRKSNTVKRVGSPSRR